MENNKIVYDRPIDNKISKLSVILIVALFCITAVILGLFAFGPYDAELEGPEFTPAMLNWAYILLGVSLVAALVFPLIAIVTKPKESVKGLLPIVGLVAVAVICYALAGNEVLNLPGYNGTDNNPDTLKWTEGLLYLMYVLIIADIAAIVITEIINKVKK